MNICYICLEDISNNNEEIYFKYCIPGHSFHLNCINKWIKLDNSCPVCRVKLPKDYSVFEAIFYKLRKETVLNTNSKLRLHNFENNVSILQSKIYKILENLDKT